LLVLTSTKDVFLNLLDANVGDGREEMSLDVWKYSTKVRKSWRRLVTSSGITIG
jgi:hypothetical protein